MRKIIILIIFFILIHIESGLAQNNGNAGQEGFAKIQTVADLKAAVNSPGFMKVIKGMNSWLPGLVSSLDWGTKMSRRFMMLYYIDVHDEDDAIFENFLNKSEDIYEQLEYFFRIKAGSKQDSLALKTRLICIIVKTRTERTFGSLTDPHHLFYFLDTKKDPRYMEKFRHEYAHWIWGRLYGEAPSFFNEGVAVYAEKMSYPGASLDNFLEAVVDIDKVPPLNEIAFNENFWKHRGVYTAGGLFIYYLVGKYGWQPLKRLFLLSEFEDKKILEHFKQAYGTNLDDIDKKWRNFIKLKLIEGSDRK